MCIVTNKLKFCTCKTGSVEQLKHYWILYRYNSKKEWNVIGEVILPMELSTNYEENKKTLSQRINETDAFDFATDFKDNDCLEISINNPETDVNPHSKFCFSFKKGKWKFEEYDVFHLINYFDEVQFGKLSGVRNKRKTGKEL